jgi:hypothetical protein
VSAHRLLVVLALIAAGGAQARDTVLRLPVAAALADATSARIVGNMPLRFGSASAVNTVLVLHASAAQLRGAGSRDEHQ